MMADGMGRASMGYGVPAHGGEPSRWGFQDTSVIMIQTQEKSSNMPDGVWCASPNARTGSGRKPRS